MSPANGNNKRFETEVFTDEGDPLQMSFSKEQQKNYYDNHNHKIISINASPKKSTETSFLGNQSSSNFDRTITTEPIQINQKKKINKIGSQK